MAKDPYDVGSYNPDVEIDLDKLIFENRQFGKGSRNLNKLVLISITEGIDRLARMAEDYIKGQMLIYGITGELYTNVKVERIGEGFQVSTYAQSNWGFDYSMYVEFGTGLVGSQNPHPRADMFNWTYTTQHEDRYGNLQEGWIYPSNPNDVNKNKWIGSDGQLYAFTKGQKASPFMYDTWMYLSLHWKRVLQGHINRALKEWGDSFR